MAYAGCVRHKRTIKVCVVPHRHELSHEEYVLLQPLLPHTQNRGRYYQELRRLLDGKLFRSNTATPWCDLTKHYPLLQAVYSRFRRWIALSGPVQ